MLLICEGASDKSAGRSAAFVIRKFSRYLVDNPFTVKCSKLFECNNLSPSESTQRKALATFPAKQLPVTSTLLDSFRRLPHRPALRKGVLCTMPLRDAGWFVHRQLN